MSNVADPILDRWFGQPWYPAWPDFGSWYDAVEASDMASGQRILLGVVGYRYCWKAPTDARSIAAALGLPVDIAFLMLGGCAESGFIVRDET